VFGSYDDAPAHRSLVSLYKNLQHHFVHQHSQREASTFWTGLGAIRRDIFFKMGGFNESFARPSIEDIELGIRLRRSGHRIWLCSDIQATHLKRWSLLSLLQTDIFDRAVPWTQLILATSHTPTDLNLDFRNRASALVVWMFCLLVMLGFRSPPVWIGALIFLGMLVALNYPLYQTFSKIGGVGFAVVALGLHMLYFAYSSLTFVLLSSWHIISKILQRTKIFRGTNRTGRGFLQ
jgi:glycosyl transferase family 7 (putative galactosyltransferase)